MEGCEVVSWEGRWQSFCSWRMECHSGLRPTRPTPGVSRRATGPDHRAAGPRLLRRGAMLSTAAPVAQATWGSGLLAPPPFYRLARPLCSDVAAVLGSRRLRFQSPIVRESMPESLRQCMFA